MHVRIFLRKTEKLVQLKNSFGSVLKWLVLIVVKQTVAHWQTLLEKMGYLILKWKSNQKYIISFLLDIYAQEKIVYGSI